MSRSRAARTEGEFDHVIQNVQSVRQTISSGAAELGHRIKYRYAFLSLTRDHMNVQYVAPLAAVIACWSASFAAPALRTNPPNRFVTAQVVTPHPDDARPTVCTEQYDPVCARAGDVVKTYSNVCFARVAGATDIAQGPCPEGRTPPSAK